MIVTDADSIVERFEHGGATVVVEDFPATRSVGTVTYVLVHGIGMGRTVFSELIGELRQSSRVLAVDLPGYGEAPEPSRPLSIEAMADLLAGMLRDRRIGGVTLVGHSMGSQVVTEVAARHPDLVAGIALVAPTVNARERRALRQILRLAQDLVGERPSVLLRGAREYLRAGPHLRAKLRAMLVHRPEDAYPRVHARSLVIRGERDVVCPQDWCERVARLLPDAELAVVPGHGHETMIRDSAPTVDLLARFAHR